MKLEEDLREFVELLNSLDVRYIVVGAYALAYHGHVRYTADIDLFIERSQENADRLMQAMNKFGFGQLNFTSSDFMEDNQVIQLGVSPNRIDLLTFLSGVSFDEAWTTREPGEIDGLNVPFISREMLKRTKAATGRQQDLADLEQLESGE